MRVDFSGVEIAMAEELLDVTNAGPATQEMSRARVAEGVNCSFEVSLDCVVADAVGDHLIGKTMARN